MARTTAEGNERPRDLTRRDWPDGAAADDVVIVKERVESEPRFVVYSVRGPQFMCRSYAEAQARALSYAGHACATVWFAAPHGLQFIGSFVRRTIAAAGGMTEDA